MTYFLPQYRHLRLESDTFPTFPTLLVAKVKFGPEDAFGVTGSLPRTTAKQSRPANLRWNANEGTSIWEGDLIEALNTGLEGERLSATWGGNELVLTAEVNSQDAANQLILSANQILPALLSLRLRVFVWIREFVVKIGESKFRFETSTHSYGITIATTEHNEGMATQSIQDWLALRPESVRLVMASYYWRHAMRLANLEPSRQSLTAEVILNLAKAIEIILSSNRERLRSRAIEWGFESDFIEKRIIPVLLIRNKLDVAHVTTGPLSAEQHQVILDFTGVALTQVNTLIARVFEMSKSGDIELDPVSASMDKEKEDLLQDIADYLTSE